MTTNSPLWYKDAIFYELHVRAFYDSNADGIGDLPGLTEKLDYLQTLGVNCLWLLPIYPSPRKDDGYDIADYYNIDPAYGTMQDFENFIHAAHQRGLRVIMDLVLNHTSDQHPWFQAARASKDSPYRDYYVWSDTDQKYADARIIFLDTEPSNWTWDEQAGQYYWHRFYASQPDLNYDNPAVRQEMLRVADFWLQKGIDGFRADAVPYLIEREGSNCENLPETHDYLKQLRAHIDEGYPGRILLCEANQSPQDVRPYFGEGDEFHMGFHFPLMPRIYMSLQKETIRDLQEILAQTPPIPENCQWCIFLRNHDELTLEMVTEEERQWMWQQYAPDPRMKLNLGIRRRLAPLLQNDRARLELANSLLLTLPGAPIIYYGDEIGMGDNLLLPDRDGVRTPMQWDSSPQAGFSTTTPATPLLTGDYAPERVNVQDQLQNPASLFHALRHMLQVRQQSPALGQGSLHWHNPGNPAIALYERRHLQERVLILHNLSGLAQVASLGGGFPAHVRNLLTDQTQPLPTEILLQPRQFLWLALED